MKIIDKKDFLPIVCMVYTVLSIGKIILEAIVADKFGNEQQNFLVMFLLSFLATLVLSQHYRFQRFSLLFIIIVQYLVLIFIVLLITWIAGLYSPLSPNAYKDMFWSFTIPYLIGAVVYYVNVLLEVKKANDILNKIKKREEQ